MHLAETGSGPSLLLLHGAGVSGWMWRLVLRDLGGRAHVLLPDLPGHGSSGDDPYRSHSHTVDKLAQALATRAPEGAVVAGFSLGAQLAILLAASRPELVRGVVVISGQTQPLPMSKLSLAVVSASAPLARRPWFAKAQAAQLGIPAELLGQYVHDSTAISRETLITSVRENLDFRLPRDWSSYPGPAVVMVGARERRVMLESAQATHRALPGSGLQVVPGCGHDLPLRRPGLVASACLEFLGP